MEAGTVPRTGEEEGTDPRTGEAAEAGGDGHSRRAASTGGRVFYTLSMGNILGTRPYQHPDLTITQHPYQHILNGWSAEECAWG